MGLLLCEKSTPQVARIASSFACFDGDVGNELPMVNPRPASAQGLLDGSSHDRASLNAILDDQRLLVDSAPELESSMTHANDHMHIPPILDRPLSVVILRWRLKCMGIGPEATTPWKALGACLVLFTLSGMGVQVYHVATLKEETPLTLPLALILSLIGGKSPI